MRLESPLRLLVLGCGSIGKRHIGNLLTLGESKIYAFDIRLDRLEEVETKFNINVIHNIEDAWAHRPDVVFITTPTRSHIQLAMMAAEKGCHLFIEKPLSDSLDKVNLLIDKVSERNLVTLVGCNLRFHPDLIEIKKLIELGAIGTILSTKLEFGQYLPDWHPWEDYRNSYSAKRSMGGGIILDAIHEFDFIRWIMGEVSEVSCFADKLSSLEIDTEDTAAVLLRFISGSIGEIHVDYIQRVYNRTCRIIGEEGTIHWDFLKGKVHLFSKKRGNWTVVSDTSDWDANNMYINELRHLLGCIGRNESSALDVYEGKKVLEIALAAKASSDSGNVIHLKNK